MPEAENRDDDGDGDDPVVVGAVGGAALSNLNGWGMLSIMCARMDTEPNYFHAYPILLVFCSLSSPS